jgi:hypothetical protein
MQTLRNFIRESLIIEGDEANKDDAGEESTLGAMDVLSAAAGNPDYDATVKSTNDLLKTHREDIKADVDAQLFSAPVSGGPGTLISDADVLNLRKTIAYLLERDIRGGLEYPYRTALFLTGYEKGITTFGEITDTAAEWALAVVAKPVQYALSKTTASPMGGDPDALSTLKTAGVVGAGVGTLGGAAWLIRHIAGHYIAEKGFGALMRAPFIGSTYESFSRRQMAAVVDNPAAWKRLITGFEEGTARETSKDRGESLIRPLLRYQEGVLWNKFIATKRALKGGFIDSIDTPPTIDVAILLGDVGSANSKQVGSLTVNMSDIIGTKVSGNDFVNETIRLVLSRCFGDTGAEAATKTAKSAIEEIFSSGIDNPITTLFKDASAPQDFTRLAELVDATGNKPGTHSKFENWLKQQIQQAVAANADKIPNNMTYTDINTRKALDELPGGYRLAIQADREGEKFVDNLISGKDRLVKLTELFVPAVEQLTGLGKVAKAGRIVVIGMGVIATNIAAYSTAAGVLGGLSAAIQGEKVDELTAVKVALDAKIRIDAAKAFASILTQEPDLDVIRWNLTLSKDSMDQFKTADRNLSKALITPVGGDEDAVQLMTDALNAYTTALDDQAPPTNEHTINLLGKLIKEFLSHN